MYNDCFSTTSQQRILSHVNHHKKKPLDYKENYASTRSLETLFKLKEKTLLKSTKKVGRLNEIQPCAIEKTEIIYCLKPISIICMLFEK